MSDRGTGSGSPYRSGSATAPSAEPHEIGLVDELIQQFADPLAFYRELVQNSIDAGSTRIAVTLGFDEIGGGGAEDPLGIVRISVRDDGCGMSRDVLENQLTVLFRSGKEGQADKIGKFGVGFVSVLALAPERVVVRTSEGRGETWTLVLKSDQTYELFRAQGGGESGTSVTLEIERPLSALEELVEGSERALVTWCRHAELPIRFVATPPSDAPMREVRIDRPLGLDALVQVRITKGPTTVVAGVPVRGASYLGFFNRGLLLHETTKDLFGAVHVKVQDANLEHTLSRDNVRRDEHYHRAMRLVRRAVERDLRAQAQRLLHEVSEGRVDSPSLDALLLGVLRAGLAVDYGAVALPLVDAVDGAGAWPVDRLARGPGYVAARSTALTEALARRGVPVIDLSAAADAGTYVAVLERLLRRTPVRPEAERTLLSPIKTTGADELLLSRVAELLEACARRPSAVHLAVAQGKLEDRLSLTAELDGQAVAVSEEEASEDPFRLLMRPPLVLNVEHDLVARAREVASSNPDLAAAMLARAVLLTRGRLDEGGDDEWLEAALEGVAS